MTARVMIAGVLRQMSRRRAMVGGVLREVNRVQVMQNGQLRTIYEAGGATPTPSPSQLAVTADSNAYGYSAGRIVTSNPVTVTAAGGIAPYTYAWTVVSASQTISALSPSSATTRFRGIMTDSVATAVGRCLVTDSVGATGIVDVGIELSTGAAT